MELLLTFCMSPGILDEKMHLFLATALTAGQMALEQGEDIHPFCALGMKPSAMVRRGEIRDAKTLVGLLYYERFMRGDARRQSS